MIDHLFLFILLQLVFADSGFAFLPSKVNMEQIYPFKKIIKERGGIVITPRNFDEDDDEIMQVGEDGKFRMVNTDLLEDVSTLRKNHQKFVGKTINIR